MGTALTKEEKIQKLRELVEEWVQHLQLWEKVEVTEVIRTEANIPYMEVVKDDYGREKEMWKHNVVKIPPSPYVVVRYYQAKGKWKDILHPTGHETKEFPFCEIDKRIIHYKYKLKNVNEKTS